MESVWYGRSEEELKSCMIFFVLMKNREDFHKSIDFLSLYHLISKNQKLNFVLFLIRNI